MRLVAWGCVVGLAGCQLVAGITDGSSHGPCTDDSECPATESCVASRCQAKGTSGSAGAGAQGGSSVGGDGGQTNMGGNAGRGGSSASGGSGLSQAGATVDQGGGGGAGGVSGGAGSGGSDSGEGGDAGAGEPAGMGGVGAAGNAGTAGTGGGGAGGGGVGGGGAGGSAADGGGGTTAGSSGSSGTAGTGGAGPIRIMPLGDGITASTCMRAFLWSKLRDNAYPAFDFVGSRVSSDTCSPTDYDKDNEGHNGYRVGDLLAATSQHTDPGGDPYTGSSADLSAWFDGRPADIVLMVFGSNDFLSTDHSAADVQNAYSAILSKLRSVNPRVTLMVGLLPPMDTDRCDTSCASRRSDLNSAMPNWAASASSADSRVVVVDLSTGFDLENTTDGIKPNDAGAEFLAERWYAALDSL